MILLGAEMYSGYHKPLIVIEINILAKLVKKMIMQNAKNL